MRSSTINSLGSPANGDGGEEVSRCRSEVKTRDDYEGSGSAGRRGSGGIPQSCPSLVHIIIYHCLISHTCVLSLWVNA